MKICLTIFGSIIFDSGMNMDQPNPAPKIVDLFYITPSKK